jgi:biopolymer transport protein ExbD
MKWLLILILFFITFPVTAQDITVLLKEADNLERQIKETEALEKYKLVIGIDPSNLKALIRASELNASIGGRQSDKNTKRLYFETSLAFAKKALLIPRTLMLIM